MKKVSFFILLNIGFIFLLFQNCSKVSFSPKTGTNNSLDSTTQSNSSIDLPPICDPLTNSICASSDPGIGLKGKLYYLTHELHDSLFKNNLNSAKLEDYFSVGIQVPNSVLVSNIDVPQRSWDTGFLIDGGELVESSPGQTLFEYFALDLRGFIELPQGEYQFAINSDDGMRVQIDNQDTVVDDSTHATRFKCANVFVSGGAKLPIRVSYYQGPRYHITMQLFVRPKSEASNACDISKFKIVEKSVFTY